MIKKRIGGHEEYHSQEMAGGRPRFRVIPTRIDHAVPMILHARDFYYRPVDGEVPRDLMDLHGLLRAALYSPMEEDRDFFRDHNTVLGDMIVGDPETKYHGKIIAPYTNAQVRELVHSISEKTLPGWGPINITKDQIPSLHRQFSTVDEMNRWHYRIWSVPVDSNPCFQGTDSS